MTSADLAQALLAAVRAQRFEQTADARQGGAAVGLHPSIDLAVAAFPAASTSTATATACFANVLFSREHPQGWVADIGADAGPVRDIAFLADAQDGAGNSIAWLPGSDWQSIRWQPLTGHGPRRFVSPYPASLLKLMVLVGLAWLVDLGRTSWEQPIPFAGRQRPLADWAFDMITVSSNEATSALVAHLHVIGAIRRAAGVEVHNELHELFLALGLPGLRFANTQADGGWGNAAGAGVGQLQMTAWDTLRLLWWLDPQAPPPPWLAGSAAPTLSDASRCQVLHCLREQGLHEILSSSLLAGRTGWVAGLPARLAARWLLADGSAQVGNTAFPGDLRRFTRQGLVFAHKTGNTENYSADAGIVNGVSTGSQPERRHYLIALTSNLGSRYAPDPGLSTTWRLPALGAAIDDFLRQQLGD